MHTSPHYPFAKEDAESAGTCPWYREIVHAPGYHYISYGFQKRRQHTNMPVAAQLHLELGCTYSRNPLTRPQKDKQHSYLVDIKRGDSGDLCRLSSCAPPCTIYLPVLIRNHSQRNFHKIVEENHLFLYICHTCLLYHSCGNIQEQQGRELQFRTLFFKIIYLL